jgi:hypothetical protein
MIIRYEDGSRAHAVIYRLIGGNLRAAVEGIDDPVDFRLIRGKWTSKSGSGVTFEFPIEIGMEFIEPLKELALSVEHGHCVMGDDCVIRRIADCDSKAQPN